MWKYLYPLRTSIPPLLLALLARESIGLVIISLPSVSSTSAASLSSARSESKVTRATANCSSRPLHLQPGISTPQIWNSSAGCKNWGGKKQQNKKYFSDPPPAPSTSAVWSQSCRGNRKKNYQNKAKESGKYIDESVEDAVHRRKTKKLLTLMQKSRRKAATEKSRENCALPCLPNRRFASDPTEEYLNSACRYCRINSLDAEERRKKLRKVTQNFWPL